MRVIGTMGGVRCCGGMSYWNGCCGNSLLARPIANGPYRLVAHANSEYSLMEHANSEYSLLERIRYWHRTERWRSAAKRDDVGKERTTAQPRGEHRGSAGESAGRA